MEVPAVQQAQGEPGAPALAGATAVLEGEEDRYGSKGRPSAYAISPSAVVLAASVPQAATLVNLEVTAAWAATAVTGGLPVRCTVGLKILRLHGEVRQLRI